MSTYPPLPGWHRDPVLDLNVPDSTDYPPPEHIGDIYRVEGYPASGMVTYGAAYRGPKTDCPGHWSWWLELSDGDCVEWQDGVGWDEDMGFDRITLLRRNPLPKAGTQ